MKTISAKKYPAFIWDGCHRFYLIKADTPIKDINSIDFGDILPIKELPKHWKKSCELRFINEYGTLNTIVPQFGTETTIKIKE